MGTEVRPLFLKCLSPGCSRKLGSLDGFLSNLYPSRRNDVQKEVRPSQTAHIVTSERGDSSESGASRKIPLFGGAAEQRLPKCKLKWSCLVSWGIMSAELKMSQWPLFDLVYYVQTCHLQAEMGFPSMAVRTDQPTDLVQEVLVPPAYKSWGAGRGNPPRKPKNWKGHWFSLRG